MNKLYASAEWKFDEYIEIAEERRLGFEVQEFSFPEVLDGDWKSLLDRYKKRLSTFEGDLSFHNPFFGLLNVVDDKIIQEVTRKRYETGFKVATELNVKYVVCHLHWLPDSSGPRLPKWQDRQAAFWNDYVELAEKHNFIIVVENVFETAPEILKGVIERVGSDRFKAILDLGHVNCFSKCPMEEWLSVLGRELVYMHVHNNHGEWDEHGSVLNGSIDFERLFDSLDRKGLAPVMTTEIFNRKSLEESLEYLQKKMDHSSAYSSGIQ